MSGYLTALVALGWTFAAFFSGTLSGRRANTAIVAGCVIEMVAVASLTIFLATDNQSGNLAVLGPAVVGMFLMGFGVGLGWAHLVTKVLSFVGNSGTGQGLGGDLDGAVARQRLSAPPLLA